MAAETPTWIFMVGGRWDRCSGLEEDVEKEKRGGQRMKPRRGEVGGGRRRYSSLAASSGCATWHKDYVWYSI